MMTPEIQQYLMLAGMGTVVYFLKGIHKEHKKNSASIAMLAVEITTVKEQVKTITEDTKEVKQSTQIISKEHAELVGEHRACAACARPR